MALADFARGIFSCQGLVRDEGALGCVGQLIGALEEIAGRIVAIGEEVELVAAGKDQLGGAGRAKTQKTPAAEDELAHLDISLTSGGVPGLAR